MNIVSFKSASQEDMTRHEDNKAFILEKIREFVSVNNLSPKDFVVGGSSCGTYMDYFVLSGVTDIDIFMMIDVAGLIKTSRVDTITADKTRGWTPSEVIEKDGFYFLGKKDLLICSAISALLKNKPNDIKYTRELMNLTNISVDELKSIIEEGTVLGSITVKDNNYSLVRNRMYLLDRWYGGAETPQYIKDAIYNKQFNGKIPDEVMEARCGTLT